VEPTVGDRLGPYESRALIRKGDMAIKPIMWGPTASAQPGHLAANMELGERFRHEALAVSSLKL
jgi:hypothetical protein